MSRGGDRSAAAATTDLLATLRAASNFWGDDAPPATGASDDSDEDVIMEEYDETQDQSENDPFATRQIAPAAVVTAIVPPSPVAAPSILDDLRSLPMDSLSFQIMEEIGRGAFGTVYSGVLHCSPTSADGRAIADRIAAAGTPVAVKRVEVCENTAKSVMLEIEHLRKLPPHNNLVRFVGARTTQEGQGPLKKTYVEIGMQFCGFQSVNARHEAARKNGQVISHKVLRSWTRGIIDGLRHLHSVNVIHRDIKPHNILITDEGVAKLADFGIAKTLDENATQLGATAIGTPSYMAPEVYSGHYSYSVDVWALGMMLLELTGARLWHWLPERTAFTMTASLVDMYRTGNDYPVADALKGISVHPDLRCLIVDCLRTNPNARPSSTSVRA